MNRSGDPSLAEPRESRSREAAHAAARTPGQQYWPWLAGIGAGVVLAGAVLVSALVASGGHAVVQAVLLALVAVALCVVVVGAVALGRLRRALTTSEELCGELFATLAAARGQRVHDDETDLLNRAGLELIGTQVLEAARRSGGAVHACVVEIGVGNLYDPHLPVLSPEQRRADRLATAEILRRATRSSDVLARESGDRYLVLGPGSGLHAQELERRVRVGLAQYRLSQRGSAAEGGTRQLRPTVEVGTSMLAPWDDGGVTELVTGAQTALQRRRALRSDAGAGPGTGRRRNDNGAGAGTDAMPDAGRPDAGGRAGA